MKHLLRSLVMLLPVMAMLFIPVDAKAVTETTSNIIKNGNYYDATVTNQGRLHFKIPVIYGAHIRYKAVAGSYIWCQIDSNSAPLPILSYGGFNNREVSFQVLEGSIVVTSAADGTNPAFNVDDSTHQLIMAMSESVSGCYYLEFDWYPSAGLLDTTFTTGVSVQGHTTSGLSVSYSTFSADITIGAFSGLSRADVQPQLIDPIFYTSGTSDAAGCGKLAVPYVAFQQCYQYSTSFNPTRYPCQDQSGMVYVSADDTVKPGFRLFMQVRLTESSDEMELIQWLPTNKVNIPAYHKIYNFSAAPFTYLRPEDSLMYGDYRFKQLSWSFRYPYTEDIVPNDMFEIQRAYNSDFSDAQTIALLPIEWSDTIVDEASYTYVDSSRAAWYNPVENNHDIYYRVRRTSSAVWGWEGHQYAAATNISLEAKLPAFRNTSLSSFRVDDDFDSNHKVHFSIDLLNKNYGYYDTRYSNSYWDDNAKLYIYKIIQETGDTIPILVPGDTIRAALDRHLYASDYNTFYYTHPIITYTDVVNSPCVHYTYLVVLDTTGATLPAYNGIGPWPLYILGNREPYYTNASNLDNLTGTHQTSPEYVRLTWGVTDGGMDGFVVEARPDNDTNAEWTQLGTTTSSYWIDYEADPEISPIWQYRVTMVYTCEGNIVSSSHVTTGSRSPYGRIAGRVHYEDGSGCPGITVTATRTDNNATVQSVITDSTGAYLFDSLPYGGGVEYSITPTSQTAQFRYNNTSSASATITLSLHRCISQGVDFDNISSVRFTGRVLFENSSVPVRDANFRLNGNLMRFANAPVKTDASGNFEIRVPQGSAFTLQVVKDGHTFDGDGYVRIMGDSLLTLNTPLDGVRVWDQTKVRLTGRVCGGLDQSELPLGLGLSHNNLGNNIRLVLELEGDNVSYVVRVPSDLTKDTLEYTVPHLMYGGFNDSDGFDHVDTAGITQVHYQLRRVIIEPDPTTGEFCADLFPVRWKIVQANATGYATLFSRGRTAEVLDLSSSATQHDTVREAPNGANGWGLYSRYATSNAQYKLIYRSPISITCKQLRWGMEVDYFGETTMQRQNITNDIIQVPLATKMSDGSYHYLFGAPVFKSDKYDFRVFAHEDYYYNNDPNGLRDEVRIKGGVLKVYNGMHENESHNTQMLTLELDTLGSANFTVPIDYVSFVRSDTNVQRVLDLSVESEGEYVELQAVRGYVTGHHATASDVISSTHGNIQLLDVLRDPPGSTSSAYFILGV